MIPEIRRFFWFGILISKLINNLAFFSFYVKFEIKCIWCQTSASGGKPLHLFINSTTLLLFFLENQNHQGHAQGKLLKWKMVHQKSRNSATANIRDAWNCTLLPINPFFCHLGTVYQALYTVWDCLRRSLRKPLLACNWEMKKPLICV